MVADTGAGIASFIDNSKQVQYTMQDQSQNPGKGQAINKINKQHELGQVRAN